jgi:hypothetical protein
MIKNWEHVHMLLEGNDELEVTVEFEQLENIMLRPDYLSILFGAKKVVHLGCTDHLGIIQQKLDSGQYLHNLITFVADKCLGVDINKEAIQYLRDQGGVGNVIYGDITQPGIIEILEDDYDYILLGEMLEHIENPVAFLKSIITNYGKQIKQVVITVPNAFGLPFLANALNFGQETLNPDHKYWFTPYTIMKVAYQSGLEICDLQMCVYEKSKYIIDNNKELLKSKPLLLDSIILICNIPS